MTTRMTDQQWESAIKKTKPPLPLPDAARAEIDQAISRAVARRETWHGKPCLVEDDLITVAKAAERLACLIDRLGEKESIALSEYFEPDKRPKREVAIIARVFARVCRGACGDVPRVGKTDLADIIVDDLNGILRKYTGKSITWKQDVRGFLEITCGVAGFSPRSIQRAVGRFDQNRNKESSDLVSEISS